MGHFRMPVDFYVNKSQQELEALLARLQAAQSTGRVSEVSAAGVRTVKVFSGVGRTETEILRVLYSLHLRAPDQYDNPYANRIRRTRARYTYS
jgi:hypothetical protein